jgi:hypothetical protein
VALAAPLPPCDTLNAVVRPDKLVMLLFAPLDRSATRAVGNDVIFAALIVGAVWKDGAPDPPVAGPANTLFCAAFEREKESAGVEVLVATEVVNRGERLPDEKDVTDPPPATPSSFQE